MRIWLLCILAASLAAAQSRPRFQAPPPSAAERGGRPDAGPAAGRGIGPSAGWGRGWWGWPGWWWSSSFSYEPLRAPVDPPKDQPLLIKNPDYQEPRMSPSVRDYPEGALPAAPPRAPLPATPCRLRESTGAEFESADCQVSGDMVRWLTADGRWRRASLDLVWPLRPFEGGR